MDKIYVVSTSDKKLLAFELETDAQAYLTAHSGSTSGEIMFTPAATHMAIIAKHLIPENRIKGVLARLDRIDNSENEGKRVLYYDLYTHLQEMFPDLNLSDQVWALNIDSVLAPTLNQMGEVPSA